MGSSCSSGDSVVPDPPSEQEVFDNLDVAEGKIWRIAFAAFDDDKTGRIDAGHELLKMYIAEASAVQSDQVETTIAKYATDGFLTLEAFKKLLAENAVNETFVLSTFQSLAQTEDTVESFAMRMTLERLGSSLVPQDCDLPEPVWEKVLDKVMTGADVTVSMEFFIERCGLFHRYVRTLRQQKNPISW
eukprot:TRINITY_DN52244_c0_g1_i1.p1 TRINITY_DN52244_c0_g1~~TRINITY_DN52244_c0_g1_i1.p1  ORF type:complete len:205 (-),score=33.18 TRINITY_DN52244_c0_g1_i1:55-618(-)